MFDVLNSLKVGAAQWHLDNRLDDAERADTMNASEADSCLRWQWYRKHAPDKAAPQEWGYARRGTVIEAHVIDLLRRTNIPLAYAGNEQERLVDWEHPIAVTPDGELFDEATGGVIMLEIKSIDPRANKSKLPRSRHVTQVRLGMDIRQRTCDETVMGAWLIYVDASNFDDVAAHWIDYRPGTVEAYAVRARRLLSAKKAETLPAEGTGNGDCKVCPFTHICKAGTQATASTPGRKPTSTGKKASALAPLSDRIVALERVVEEQKRLKEELKQAMLDGRLQKVDGTTSVAVLTERSGAERFDRKSAEAAGLDLQPYVKTGAPSVSLTVKPKE